MIVIEDPMYTKTRQLIRGAWTDGVQVYGWVMVHEDKETPHYRACKWDKEGKELEMSIEAHNDAGHHVQKFTAVMTLGADGEPKLERHKRTPDELRKRGDQASVVVYPNFTKGVFAGED